MQSPKIVIRGTGSCLPKHFVTNKELLARIDGFDHEAARSSFMKRSDDAEGFSQLSRSELFDLWVRKVCGVEKRPFVAPGEFPEGLVCEAMAEQAARNALNHAGMTGDDIDHVVFSTYSSDRLMPSPAATLVHRLELKQGIDGISAITLNGACSGFLDALIDGVNKLKAGFAKNILVLAAENMSNKMDFSDPTSCIIFSDGAGACILSAVDPESSPSATGKDSNNLGGGTQEIGEILAMASAIDYSEQINMQRKGSIYFNKGPYVQRNAVQAMYGIGQKALSRCAKDPHANATRNINVANTNTEDSLSMEELRYVIPHQANARITEALRKKIQKDCPSESAPDVLDTIAFTGNLSSATIPVALDLLIRGKLDRPYVPQSYTLLTSVGGGYTYSAVVIKL